ncbi:MAG TPA: hypothetical protein VKD04_02020 [Burkholderiales bacterium]|nr:hypothetical protein [Burkholderiales bacterium]
MRAALLSIMLLMAACAGGPMPPDWQSQSHALLEKFTQQYLEGNSPLAERSFAQAKSALAATGRPELVARAELIRCALGIAALDVDACLAFDSLRSDATADDQAYADFVGGRLQQQDAPRLPEQYRPVATARDEAARNKAMQQIEDPVSRLVAAGALFRLARLSPDGVTSAIETASAQGYRRPLLAYLNVQAKHAESIGDTAALQSIRKRIDLVYQSLPAMKQ